VYSLVPQSNRVALGSIRVFIMSIRSSIEHPLDRSDRLLTIPEIADYFRLSQHALYMQRLRNQPPGNLGFRVGARVLFKPEDVIAWIEKTQTDQARDELDW